MKNEKKVMQTKIPQKNRIYSIMVTSHFFVFSLKKYFYKSKKWTIIIVHFLKNQKRIQIKFFEKKGLE